MLRICCHKVLYLLLSVVVCSCTKSNHQTASSDEMFLAVIQDLRDEGDYLEARAMRRLKEAYDQLEETTMQKERIESELRIARDIQMSMVPNVFPKTDRLDIYASSR